MPLKTVNNVYWIRQCMVVLTTLSEIFLVSFSILYGIMLNACIGLGLFQFGQLFNHKIVFRRIIVSFFLITLFPVIYFAYFLLKLQNHSMLMLNIKTVIGVFLLSTSVFFFYRLLHLVVKWKCDWFYDLTKENLSKDCKKRICIIKNSDWEGQLIGVIYHFVLGLIGWLLIFN